MNTTKTITLTIVGIIASGIMLSVIQLLLRKVKLKSELDFKIKPSYGIWFAGLFMASSIITFKTVSFLGEAIDNIYKIEPANAIIGIIKISSLFIGLSVIWFLLLYFIAKVFSAVIVGIRDEQEEMGLNNIYYFLIRGISVIGFVFSLSTVLDIIFRLFMPNVQIPFYH